MKRLPQDRGQLGDILHQEIMLGARAGDPHDIGFLKRVVADEIRGNLAGDGHHRNGVGIGGGQTGDRIGSARLPR